MGEGGEAKPYLGKNDFEYEIFFSYARGDFGGEDEPPLKQWSRQLKNALQDHINFLLRTRTRIFFDDSPTGMNRTVPAREDIDRKVAASALFHLVMSPHYLESRWCRDELAKFVEALPPGPTRAEDRIFVSRAMDTEERRWPDSLYDERGSRVPGWIFYREPGVRPEGFGVDWKGFVPAEISAQLFLLVDATAAALRDLKKKAVETKRYGAFVRGEIGSIYLYAREEDEKVWQATRRDIKKLGIDVWPDRPEKFRVDEDEAEHIEHFAGASDCDAMLMVARTGEHLDIDLEVVGRDRRQLIVSETKKYMPCAVVDRNGALDDPVRRSKARRLDIDWIDTRTPDHIGTWLREEAAEKVRRRAGLPRIDPEDPA